MPSDYTPSGSPSALYKCRECDLVYSFEREPIRECAACGNTTNDLGFTAIHDGLAMHGAIEQTRLLLRKLGIEDVGELLYPRESLAHHAGLQSEMEQYQHSEDLIDLHGLDEDEDIHGDGA